MYAWSHAKSVSLLALGFTHSQSLPNTHQIIEGEDSSLQKQGILLISAKKQQQVQTTIVWKKTLPTLQREKQHIDELQ